MQKVTFQNKNRFQNDVLIAIPVYNEGKYVDEILAANADKVADYRGGKDKLFGFFVGQVMKAMQGKGNPQQVNALLKEKLDAR